MYKKWASVAVTSKETSLWKACGNRPQLQAEFYLTPAHHLVPLPSPHAETQVHISEWLGATLVTFDIQLC